MDSVESQGRAGFVTGTALFVRVLALCHALAIGTFWVQWRGLIGPGGILPAGQFLVLVHQQLGPRGWFEVPTLCWLFGTGAFLDVLCALGIVAALLLFAGRAQVLCLAFLWAAYLSIVSVGQIFFDYQWDALLLESTLIALFLVPWRLWRSDGGYEPPRLARYLAWWLLFRLMLLSGVVKLTSGDPTWRNLTALAYHFQTQPLPTPLAWYANQLPAWFLKLSCAAMFAIELVAPLLIPAPRKLRHAGALAMASFQVLIALTGNYAFFNLLSVGLCLTCLDDGWWRRVHWGVQQVAAAQAVATRSVKPVLVRWFAAASVGITFFEAVADVFPGSAASPLVQAVMEGVGPLRSFNYYGLFAVMTVERPELAIEGSDDGTDWREFELPYKPGPTSRRPAWVAPYQPRLDWQLWFAALESPDENLWVETLCERLLRGDRAVLALFRSNPFPDHPPRYARVVRYRYEFTDSAERARTGKWWRRTPLDFYFRPVTLPENSK